MPRKLCYWTRKQELELVEFVKQRDFIWKPVANTNHQIKQKYKAYAEFAAKVGSGNTARSVRDRWVNIRSTFNHNVRRVRKSQLTGKSPQDVYTPCWPLWIPLQFLAGVEDLDQDMNAEPSNSECKEQGDIQIKDLKKLIKDEFELDQFNDTSEITISMETEPAESIEDLLQHQQTELRTNRPRKPVFVKTKNKTKNCKKIVEDLITSMKPLLNLTETENHEDQSYWFFGRHVTERLNAMRVVDGHSACNDIMNILMETERDGLLTDV